MKSKRSVIIWLFIGVVMLFFQVILGGITRITGSGLSITKWDIIIGSIPPLNLEEWKATFELYKATPQYHKINGGMSLADFKFIFFWEFTHRLFARTMGFVFLFPFIYFVIKGYLNKILLKRLLVVVVLAAITASFGWIMVASGLLDRPWVNAYKLSIHLLLAFITYSYLLWTYFKEAYIKEEFARNSRLRSSLSTFIGLLWFQIFLGGLVSGMKAGLYYNSWPSMSGSFIPDVLYDSSQWTLNNMTKYDEFLFAPSLIQFIHRIVAYTLFFLGIYLFIKLRSLQNGFRIKRANNLFLFLLLSQVTLGISILLTARGSIPILYGVLHQAFAFLLLGSALYFGYKVRYR